MKVSRSILRRMEMKIFHAITADQMRKNAVSETQAKPAADKSGGEDPLMSK